MQMHTSCTVRVAWILCRYMDCVPGPHRDRVGPTLSSNIICVPIYSFQFAEHVCNSTLLCLFCGFTKILKLSFLSLRIVSLSSSLNCSLIVRMLRDSSAKYRQLEWDGCFITFCVRTNMSRETTNTAGVFAL